MKLMLTKLEKLMVAALVGVSHEYIVEHRDDPEVMIYLGIDPNEEDEIRRVAMDRFFERVKYDEHR